MTETELLEGGGVDAPLAGEVEREEGWRKDLKLRGGTDDWRSGVGPFLTEVSLPPLAARDRPGSEFVFGRVESWLVTEPELPSFLRERPVLETDLFAALTMPEDCVLRGA